MPGVDGWTKGERVVQLTELLNEFEHGQPFTPNLPKANAHAIHEQFAHLSNCHGVVIGVVFLAYPN